MSENWWNEAYVYRRNLEVISVFDFSRKYHPVTFVLPEAIKENGKVVMGSYEDLEVVFNNETALEREVLEYEGVTYVTFELQESLDIDVKDQSYKLYYGNPNIEFAVSRERIENTSPDIESQSSVLNNKIPDWAHWPNVVSIEDAMIHKTRPGEHWIDGYSSNPSARISFEKKVARLRVLSKADINSGFLNVKVDNDDWTAYDTYAASEQTIPVIELSRGQGEYVESLVLSPTGYSRYSNTGARINVNEIQFANFIQVNDKGEEIKSLRWSHFIGKA